MKGNKVRFILRSEAKMRPGGGEKVRRPLTGAKESFSKKRNVEKLISLLGAFHRKMNQVGNVKSFMKELQENIIDKGKEDSHRGREVILMKRMVAATFKLHKGRLVHKNAGSEPRDYQLQKEEITFDITTKSK